MNLKETFIVNLKKARKERRISQSSLAERCSTATSYIGEIEIGRKFPSMEMIEKIAEALEIEPYRLFVDNQEELSGEDITKKPSKKALSWTEKEYLINQLNNAIASIIKQF